VLQIFVDAFVVLRK